MTVFTYRFNPYRWAHEKGGNYAAHDGSAHWLQNHIIASDLSCSWPTPNHILCYNGSATRGIDHMVMDK